jgi:hypothetical protein
VIGAIFLAVALSFHSDGINLAHKYRAGASEMYWMRISPEGSAAPLGNAFQIRLKVGAEDNVVIEGAESPYTSSHELANWEPTTGGSVGKVLSSHPDFLFLPYAFTTNDVPLKMNELESIGGGSVKLLDDKDSVAKLRIWLPISADLVLSEDSNVEIATRRLNYANGTVYRREGSELKVVRTFSIERDKPLNPQPISQDSGGDF